MSGRYRSLFGWPRRAADLDPEGDRVALKCGQNWFHGGRGRQAVYSPLLPGSWQLAYVTALTEAAQAAIAEVNAHWKEPCPAAPPKAACPNKKGLVSYIAVGRQVKVRGQDACEMRVSYLLVITCEKERNDGQLTPVDWNELEAIAPPEHVEWLIEQNFLVKEAERKRREREKSSERP